MVMKRVASAIAYFIFRFLLDNSLLQSVECVPQVPCYFAFGDSLFDNGNNNQLPTKARVNYKPYGIDYPGAVATGRFTNGRNMVDFVAENLGFDEFVPPFASTSAMPDESVLKGVNYASGSAGIRSETGEHLGENVPLDQQIQNHGTIISRIATVLGNSSSSYMEKCVYILNMGSNDYLNNYYVPESYSTKRRYGIDEYAQTLIQQYSQQIQTLYGMGARKVALFGLGSLGCTPQAISKYGLLGSICAIELSLSSDIFNHKLHDLVDQLNTNLTDGKFTFIQTDEIFLTSSIGFKELFKPCCQVRSDGQCLEGGTTCDDRGYYAFFDNFHPTEEMNSRVGARAYNAATPFDVHPYDIRTLVHH